MKLRICLPSILSAFDKQVSQKSNLFNDVAINIKGHKKISSMVFFCPLSKRLQLQWHAYIYFKILTFTSFMDLPCYSLGTF
jgi:hypothetical protein